MNTKIRTTIKHERQSGTEYGYGLYINGYCNDDHCIYASECVSRDAAPEDIKRAERRVRARARRAYQRAHEW